VTAAKGAVITEGNGSGLGVLECREAELVISTKEVGSKGTGDG
jgi:hypothetical protein